MKKILYNEIKNILNDEVPHISESKARITNRLSALLENVPADQLDGLDDAITAYLNSEDRLRDISVLYDEWYYTRIGKLFRK